MISDLDSETFVWSEPWGVDDGGGRRLAFIHANAPRGLLAIEVYLPGAESLPVGSRTTGGFKLHTTHESARKLITRSLLGLGMVELPVKFLRLEKYTTVTETLEKNLTGSTDTR